MYLRIKIKAIAITILLFCFPQKSLVAKSSTPIADKIEQRRIERYQKIKVKFIALNLQSELTSEALGTKEYLSAAKNLINERLQENCQVLDSLPPRKMVASQIECDRALRASENLLTEIDLIIKQ